MLYELRPAAIVHGTGNRRRGLGTGTRSEWGEWGLRGWVGEDPAKQMIEILKECIVVRVATRVRVFARVAYAILHTDRILEYFSIVGQSDQPERTARRLRILHVAHRSSGHDVEGECVSMTGIDAACAWSCRRWVSRSCSSPSSKAPSRIRRFAMVVGIGQSLLMQSQSITV